MTRIFAFTALLAATLLAGCATQGPGKVQIDRTHTSQNQDSRVLFLVMHYTVGNFESSLKTLTVPSNAPVSSHYLVSENPVRTYQLVDEGRRAWHAGPSYWRGHSNLNASSIGIEIVNTGGAKGPDGVIRYKPFPQAQIDEVIALSREIVQRHNIRPERIVGHSDIQPQSKQDPGPLFPWRQLADAGLIAWPDDAMVAAKKAQYEQALPDVRWFQDKLAQWGFAPARSGEMDAYTRDVLTAFQMRFRPAKYDGQMDAETAALLDVVNDPAGMKLVQPPAQRPQTKPYTSRW
jgi:N-acetylmuramoyl-L-alanine amidase